MPPADTLSQALRGAAQVAPPPRSTGEAALVIGAGGVLGSAVLAEALAAGRHHRVAALVTGPVTSAMRGFEALHASALGVPPEAPVYALAFIVFERARHANGRDEAFVQPQPAELPLLAARLHAAGVRRLVVVVPHAPALLPHALKAGLATLDEAAVAALGFEHLVLVRAAQAGSPADAAAGWAQRFAAWWLSQLRWMVPQREQPVRAVKLAELVVRLALRLPRSRTGTRVVPPELLWQAATDPDPEALFDRWLGEGGPR